MVEEVTLQRQFCFRLPEALIEQLERCSETLRKTGLDITRTDVVRLLLKYALDATHCNVGLLFGPSRTRKRPRR